MTGTFLDRFWAKVDVRGPDECWPWTARLDAYGYGRFRMRRKDSPQRTVLAHRLAWRIAHDVVISSAELICHRCDNPCCVNPGHLFVGNYYDNMSDMIQKRRHAFGERSGVAKLTEAQVRTIRAKRATGVANKELAKEFGVDASTISLIVTGKHWKSIA